MLIRGTTHFDDYPLFKYGLPPGLPIPSSFNGEGPVTPTEPAVRVFSEQLRRELHLSALPAGFTAHDPASL